MFSLPVLEISRFRRTLLTRLALLIIILIPTFYGGVYLVANWNPTGHLDELTAAIVNDDQPADSPSSNGTDPTVVAAGDELTGQLTGSDDAGFTWVTATDATAQQGLDDGHYDAVLHIPAEFSASLTSLGGSDPRTTDLTLTTNDAHNYITGNIASTILANIRANLAKTTISTYLDNVYIGFNTIHDSVSEAATGATQLATGSTTLLTGTGSLTDGLATLNSGASDLSAGATRLADGASTLASGTTTAAGGASSLASGASRVADGTSTLAQSADDVTARISDIRTSIDTSLNAIDATTLAAQVTESRDAAAAALTDQITALQARYPDDPDIASLAQTLATIQSTLTPATDIASRIESARSTITGKADQIASSAATIDTQINTLNDGAQQVATGASALADGTAQLATGADTLATGASTLATGASTLSTGTGTALTGAQQLRSGASELNDGAKTLAEGLNSGVASIPTYSDTDRANRTDVVSSPVTATAVRENKVAAYGEGLAPYFIPLALWIGGMITYQILKAAPSRAFASRAPSWRIALAGYYPGVLFGILQAALLSAVLLLFVGVETPNPVAFTAFIALIALAFTSIHQALVAYFGGTGRLIGLVFLVMQLASAGGTYSINTSPPFFQAISPYMPLTYAVAGVRALIAGGSLAPVAMGVIAMLLTMAIALSITTLAAHHGRLWSMKRLHPSLSI
ncbi:YhgE/Pip domain-containing protein [Herbiconiux sp. CPCC 205716]|uniref:YhgE/Pip domain-containing protein n=1 Tax=Herbiconiux gentiana TaxID=2970912 RepID=A0ABT2GEM0_9MICO|nr:YhgE/Pip domain-containing protein [Herbiconiux gentiana]MCS5714682.1 YhgE/Pip domain-containing protein [Herbiconiux gentiana]